MSGARTAPPAAPAALLYAVVKSPCAVMAMESFEWKAPVMEAGDPNPVMAVPGDTPTSPLTVVAVPATFVSVEPARIPKRQAAPSAKPPAAGGGHTAEVVNVQTKLLASPLPYRSCAAVVIVAVKVALAARGAKGVKVAVLVAAT